MIVIALEVDLTRLASHRFTPPSAIAHRSPTLWTTRLRSWPLLPLNLLLIGYPVAHQRTSHLTGHLQRFRLDVLKAMHSILFLPVAICLRLLEHFLLKCPLQPAPSHFPSPFFDPYFTPFMFTKKSERSQV
jgi:hypothetical protein